MAAIDRTLTGSPDSLSSPSRTNTYETSSGSSSSTVPGPGALSGKAIKALGRVTIRGIDHLVILRQLSVIAHHFPLPDEKAGFVKDVEEIYADTLEFSRQGLYREEINRKALRLLLCQIGMGETQYLVRVLSRWDRLELRLFLSEILIQLTSLWNPQLGTVFFTPLFSAYSETEKSGHVSISPFLLFIAKLVRTHASAGRAVLDVGFLDVLILIRSLNDLNKEDILSDFASNQNDTSHRRRILAASNAVLLDILAYPELRPIVLNHPICSTWVTAYIRTPEITPFASRERALFLNSDRDIPDDNSLLYLTLDLPTVSQLGHVDGIDPGQLIDSLAFGVEHDQALRVFLLRSPYTKKVALLSKVIQHMWGHSSAPSLSFGLRTRYRLVFFLRLVAAIAWGPSNRAALLDAGIVNFLVHIAHTEVPESYRAIIDVDVPISPHAQEDLRFPEIIHEHGLGHLLGGPLSKTSRLVGLISAAFWALFPEAVSPDSMRSRNWR
ncbi:hypothetical protein B0H16DRAFT_1530551 [Mycena metata]|uniref:Uncharacterized protein n=1 Tax=Mycena metata TaxID=1033252 RepID=A0AAD7JC69_9AGAR|nr:hypothetical protein B0H16DRAFT_1530551 [Mycena metata]